MRYDKDYNVISSFSELRGNRILDIQLEKQGTSIFFITEDKKKYEYSCEGDCCSYSWFESLDGKDNLIGEVILEVIDKEENKPSESNEEHECLQFYGFTFKTVKGYCDLEMRNSSNGYYGGSICGPTITEI